MFMFSTKAEQDKRLKEERAAKLANANFCPPALIPLASFSPMDRLAKCAASPHLFRPVPLFTQLEVAFLITIHSNSTLVITGRQTRFLPSKWQKGKEKGKLKERKK